MVGEILPRESGRMIKLTVFTPTYNRAHTLKRTYDSLLEQSCKNFIWLIIDDGSTDNTRELVDEWRKNENGFEIQYIYKENGGMHTAHNVAYENIHTELNVCIDSDDCMGKNAVQLILDKWDQVYDKGYAGIIGLDADFEGNVIGCGFPGDLQETTVIGYYHSGGKGDKKLVYRTDIINKYPPYPVFEGEKYVALSYKYRLIDQTYKMAVLNQVLCNVEYQEEGSSMNMYKQYVQNPKGFAFWRRITMQYPVSKKRQIVDCIHYCSSSFIAKNKNYIKKSPKKIMTILCTPIGILVSIYIKNSVNRQMKVG